MAYTPARPTGPGGTPPPPSGSSSPPSSSAGGSATPPDTPTFQFLQAVTSKLNDPYVYGDAGPNAFDCSGLVQWAAQKAGFKGVPRTSEAQWGWVQKISQSQLQPGDLVFSQWPGDNATPGHVQVYVGNGQVIGADTTDVERTTLAAQQGHIVGYGRMPGSTGGSSIGNFFSGVINALTGGGGSLLSLALPQDVLDMFSGAEKLVTAAAWFINPENWARVIAGGMGVILLIIAAFFLVRAGM